jgi:hypothetical protein
MLEISSYMNNNGADVLSLGRVCKKTGFVLKRRTIYEDAVERNLIMKNREYWNAEERREAWGKNLSVGQEQDDEE